MTSLAAAPSLDNWHDASDDEEIDQKRHLSEIHGEAAEASTDKRKADDENLEDAYKQRAKRAPRPKIDEKLLTSSDGLIKIPREFRLRYNGPSNAKESARYSRSLMDAYRKFFADLQKHVPFETALHQTEKLGSKAVVRSFLEEMRNEVRDKHLKRVYGEEKAKEMLKELDFGLQQQEAMSGDGDFVAPSAEDSIPVELTESPPASGAPQQQQPAPAAPTEEDSDDELEFEAPKVSRPIIDESDEEEDEIGATVARRPVLSEDDDEEGPGASPSMEIDPIIQQTPLEDLIEQSQPLHVTLGQEIATQNESSAEMPPSMTIAEPDASDSEEATIVPTSQTQMFDDE